MMPLTSNQNFSFALQFQPQAFAALTLISWGQTLYYHKYVQGSLTHLYAYSA
jgi:hypothetical protein